MIVCRDTLTRVLLDKWYSVAIVQITPDRSFGGQDQVYGGLNVSHQRG